ncbi:hypothetical protein OQA88_10990 [Cercophora sp. LCS_1]
MAPLIHRSEQTLPTQGQSDASNMGVTPTSNPFSLGGILAIVFGVSLALLLAGVIFSMSRKRQQASSSSDAKSMAQANFFHKLGVDQRAFDAMTASEKGMGRWSQDRDSIWGRDSILYAAPTARDARRKVEEDPSKVWVIKPIAPAVLAGGR